MKTRFKYILEKGSKKHSCPSCGKKTFVQFLDPEKGEKLSSEFGRCDREQKCGYFRKPESSETLTDFTKFVPEKMQYTPLNLLDVEKHFLGKKLKNDNLLRFFKTFMTKDQLNTVILDYMIGTIFHWNSNATIFWSIDQSENVCNGKIMLYDPYNGRRIKKPFPHINSYHNLEKKSGRFKDYNIKPCLFGTHLITTYKNKNIIAICESEKSACIMSTIFPKFIWMATGGLSNIKEESFRPIKSKTIILYPDLGAYDKWVEKSKELSKLGYTISASNILETNCPDGEKGSDIMDYFINSNTKK